MQEWIKVQRHLKKIGTSFLYYKKDRTQAEKEARQADTALKMDGVLLKAQNNRPKINERCQNGY